MAVLTVTKDNFQQEVMESDKKVLIDFYATWCGPCSMLSPIIAEIADERPDIKVCKVNVDEEPEVAALFQVQSIPLVVVMQDGKMVNGTLGYKPKDYILGLLEG